MISILFATGFEKLDNTLATIFKKQNKVELIEQRVYFREGLGDSIIRNQPSIVLLSDKLEGNTVSLEQLIRITRKRHPETRIVFILADKDNFKLRKLLYQLSVYDVFNLEPKLNVKELYNSFFNPNEWKDVANQFPELEEERYELDEDFVFNSKDGIVVEEEYSPFETKFKQNIDPSLKTTAAFWSIRQQSGTTFLSINTALLLAQHSEQKVLLVDFNPNNPNIHIQFNLNDKDGNRNLAALCQDIDSKSISRISEVDDYLITHPFYSNIRVMLGLAIKDKKPSQETLTKAFGLIMEYAKKEDFTSVLFDLESGLVENYIIEVLKKVDVIISPITESNGNIIAAQKIFDREFGPFFLNVLDLKKYYPIINKSTNDEDSPKILHILQSFLNRKIDAVIPQDKIIYDSVQKGSPLLKNQCPSEILRPLSITANYIHNIFSIQPVPEKKNKKRFGLF